MTRYFPLRPPGREAENDTLVSLQPNSSYRELIGYYLHTSVMLSRLHSPH
jgi:hypothetical protein